jgi:transcriptional regulator with XRE-family HTH domain
MSRPKDGIPEPALTFFERDLVAFGHRIVCRRRTLGWNQKELGVRTAIPFSRLSRLERGKVEPRLTELIRLKTAFGGTVDALISEPEPPSAQAFVQLLREVELQATADEIESLSRVLSLLALGLRRVPDDNKEGSSC